MPKIVSIFRLNLCRPAVLRLNLMILADFKGEMADNYARLERLIQQWCVEAGTINNWTIPFPQLTFHWLKKEKLMPGENHDHC